MGKTGKRYRELAKLVDKNRFYSLDEAVELVKQTAKTKFEETVDLAVRLGLNPTQADHNIRGTVSLPYGVGKTVKVLVFAEAEEHIREAEEAGADIIGTEDVVEQIRNGWTDFDVAIATPDMMRVVAQLGRFLRHLTPSARTGTVTTEIGKTVQEVKAGKIEYRFRAKAGPIIQVPIGKTSFENEQIKENTSVFMGAIVKAKPASAKGRYLRSVTMSATMGPGVKMDTQQFL